jgi:hypothetical protein
MIAQQFVALEIGVIKCIFAEEDASVTAGYNEATKSHDQGVLKPLAGDTFKSLYDASVPTIPRETKHHYCRYFGVEIISCGKNNTINLYCYLYDLLEGMPMSSQRWALLTNFLDPRQP